MTSCPDCGDPAPLSVTCWVDLEPDRRLLHICESSEWIGYTVRPLDLDAELGR